MCGVDGVDCMVVVMEMVAGLLSGVVVAVSLECTLVTIVLEGFLAVLSCPKGTRIVGISFTTSTSFLCSLLALGPLQGRRVVTGFSGSVVTMVVISCPEALRMAGLSNTVT